MASQQANVQLLIIDPQNDFCDIAGAALPVPGANADLQRVAALVAQQGAAFAEIHVTLDSHNPFDIAHPAWWQDQAGLSPSPFTVISVADVETGRWRASDTSLQARSLAYVNALAARGRYQLIVWPEHCLMGGWGHNVQQDLASALAAWGRSQLKAVNYVSKGTNPATEHYSAIQAEVPDENDPATLPDPRWIARMAAADTILVAGQALSHCVASTVRDLADQLGADQVSKLVLLTDCASPVSGFEALGEAFIDEMVARGMRIASSQEVVALLDQRRSAEVVTLYRPTGPAELALVQQSGNKRWPPRLPEQPIFYPVTNEAYAVQIASDWNVKQSGAGYVTRFDVLKSFMDRYPVQCVGASGHTEWWVPAEDLEALNDHIVGLIEVTRTFPD